jgi:uncharacterized protein (TIGR02646 family)
MRRIRRLALGRKAQVWLFQRTREVLVAEAPKDKAASLWASTGDPRSRRKHRYRREFQEVLVRMTSGGLCMYCEHNSANEVEHFWPKSVYPERTFCWDNLLLICGECNNLKGAKLEVDERGGALFIDPTVDEPGEHLELSPKEGRFVARDGSRKGDNMSVVLNRNQLIRRRTEAWSGLQGLLVSYAIMRARGDTQLAEVLRKEICSRSFPTLLACMLRAAELSEPERYINVPGCLAAIREHYADFCAWAEA